MKQSKPTEVFGEYIVSIGMIKESLRNCKGIPDQIMSGLNEQPDSFFQGLIETVPKGLDEVRGFLGPELVEWASIIFYAIHELLRK